MHTLPTLAVLQLQQALNLVPVGAMAVGIVGIQMRRCQRGNRGTRSYKDSVCVCVGGLSCCTTPSSSVVGSPRSPFLFRALMTARQTCRRMAPPQGKVAWTPDTGLFLSHLLNKLEWSLSVVPHHPRQDKIVLRTQRSVDLGKVNVL